MNDQEKQQLREDLEFALITAERLTVLDRPESTSSSSNRTNPLAIKSLTDLYAVFGYTASDLIDRHDQIHCFAKIRQELENLLQEFASPNSPKYDQAVLLRDRLQRINKEFIAMGCNYELRRQKSELNAFDRGVQLTKEQTTKICNTRVKRAYQVYEAKRIALEKTHSVQKDQLEVALSRIPQPPMKYSKLLLELKATERNLAKLRLFEDAKTVAIRADKMEADERNRYELQCQQAKDIKRKHLKEKQSKELVEFNENSAENRFIAIRKNEKHQWIDTQRMTNLQQDLEHANIMDLHKTKRYSMEFNIPMRKNAHTRSSLRGQQVLSTLTGKRLEVASLCHLHDDEKGITPLGSFIYQ